MITSVAFCLLVAFIGLGESSFDHTRDARYDLPDAGVWNTSQNLAFSDNDSGCKCTKVGANQGCGCCLDVNLGSPICVNVSYIPSTISISLTITFGNLVLLNKTLSASNPPPLCVGIPYLKEVGSVCVDLHDLKYTKNTLHGCLKIILKLAFISKDFELGCFDIPLPGNSKDAAVYEARLMEMVSSINRARQERLNKFLLIEKQWDNMGH